MRRFAKFWDLIGNSGNFVASTPLLWKDSHNSSLQGPSAFAGFMAFSDWIFARIRRTDTIALLRLLELLFEFLTQERGLDPQGVAPILWRDYQRGGRHDRPGFLAAHLPAELENVTSRKRTGPKRQARFVGGPQAE